MEQKNNCRENFWKSAVDQAEEVKDYSRMLDGMKDSVLTTTYEFLTLLCC